MRCWDCKSLIVMPEIIDGQPGVAGMLRAGLDEPGRKQPQVITQEVSCGRCGAQYQLTTAKKPGLAKVERRNEGRREGDK